MPFVPTSSSAAPAAASAVTLLSTTTIGTAAAFDVSAIDQTYNDLILVLITRSSAAVTGDTLGLRLNNDSGANYFDDTIRANGTTVSAVQDLAATSLTFDYNCPGGNSAVANTFSFHTIEIQGYTSTLWRKGVFVTSGGGTSTATLFTTPQLAFGWWNSTAAVSRVGIIPGNTPFTCVTGSVLRIYGRL